jgi:hypothetical protein
MSLECILCEHQFSLDDVRLLNFFPSTGVCFDCYQKGQSASFATWCFGKTSVTGPNGNLLQYGYDPEAKVCSEECPDRRICPLFWTGQIQEWRDEMVKVQDAPVAEVHKMKKKLKGYKGPPLPFYQPEAMTTKAFLICMKGVMVDDLVKWVKAQGGSSARVLRIMRSGSFNGKRWKVNEANGYIRVIYDGQSA